MNFFRRFLTITSIALVLIGGAPSLVEPAAAQGDTAAVAINTKDGASIFRLAFHVRRVANGVVDQGNAAAAVASCTECQTVALAFQVVLVFGNASTVTPENLALAYNQECASCLTYAAATQLVLGFDGPVRLTQEGNERLRELYKRLQELGNDEELTVAELDAAVEAARTELRAIFTTEVEAVGSPPDDEAPTSETTTTTTTTTTPERSTTTTTVRATTTTVQPTTTTSSTTTTSTP